MRTTIIFALMASALATPGFAADPARGVTEVNVPVITRADYAFDAAAPDGTLSPSERARLSAWFGGLGLGYGDRVYVSGPYADSARMDVAEVAGQFGMLISPGFPVTSGAVNPGAVRVIVTRTTATVPGCPHWETASQPNYANRAMPNFGCGVNGNMAAMVADPQDLVWGRESGGVVDSITATRAIQSYRKAAPTGEKGLIDVNTKGDK